MTALRALPLLVLFTLLCVGLVACEDKKSDDAEKATEPPSAEEATAACQDDPEATAGIDGCRACCTNAQKRPGFMYDGMAKTCTCE